MELIETLPTSRWDGPFPAALRDRAIEALETGKVLFLPELAVPLSPEDRLLLEEAASDGKSKNISLEPGAEECKGTALDPPRRRRLATVMCRYATLAEGLLLGLCPAYAGKTKQARTSFRPVEIEGRRVPSWRRDDTRLHVDAFPTRPTQGHRILRVFSNVDGGGRTRLWEVGIPFEEFARAFLPRLFPPLPGAAAFLRFLGLTQTTRSAYDQMMLSLHNAAKRDLAWQKSAPRQPVAFPPGSTWLVYTDQVLHAVHAGRNAFEQTFHLPLEAMHWPEMAPLSVLERLSGRRLVH